MVNMGFVPGKPLLKKNLPRPLLSQSPTLRNLWRLLLVFNSFSYLCLPPQTILPAATRPIWWLPLILSSCPRAAHLRGSQKTTKNNNNKKSSSSSGGSTNMPLFGRVHKCKEYEYWNEKKVWIVSVMKWTLSKNERDPQKDTSKIPRL